MTRSNTLLMLILVALVAIFAFMVYDYQTTSGDEFVHGVTEISNDVANAGDNT